MGLGSPRERSGKGGARRRQLRADATTVRAVVPRGDAGRHHDGDLDSTRDRRADEANVRTRARRDRPRTRRPRRHDDIRVPVERDGAALSRGIAGARARPTGRSRCDCVRASESRRRPAIRWRARRGARATRADMERTVVDRHHARPPRHRSILARDRPRRVPAGARARAGARPNSADILRTGATPESLEYAAQVRAWLAHEPDATFFELAARGHDARRL